ncbi:MAG: glycosyltransferase family 2 protein [Lachnospiraceae bacterium]|nr:glycosyltransferase family 2 protein [Lachnospiraceae bacterium]
MPKVSIIIPNYNGANYINDCIDSLAKQAYKDHEIIVVDNDSKDGSADMVENDHPDVRLKRLDQNYGFSRAVNEGLKMSDAPFVLLLNSDTRAEEGFVEALVNEIEKDESVFSVASKMIQMNEPAKLDGAGDLYSAFGWAYARGKGRSSKGYNRYAKVFAACGGAAIYRRSILDEIGWFDEFHFAYLEDIDIGYRARIMGYKNVYCPEARIYHVGSAVTGSRYNDFKIRLSARNNMYVIMKNMPLLQIIINLPFLALGFAIKAFFFILIGHGRAYLSGLKRGYILCRQARKFPYSTRNFKNYCRIQLELWLNLFRRLPG